MIDCSFRHLDFGQRKVCRQAGDHRDAGTGCNRVADTSSPQHLGKAASPIEAAILALEPEDPSRLAVGSCRPAVPDGHENPMIAPLLSPIKPSRGERY